MDFKEKNNFIIVNYDKVISRKCKVKVKIKCNKWVVFKSV